MRTLIAAGLILGLGGLAAADDKKADPGGTWKWETERGGQKRETTLKLKLDGDKVTGTITGGRGKGEDVKIEDGKFKDGQVTFSVTRERGDAKIVTKYAAKADGDTLKGTATSERGGRERTQEFEAKREKVKD